MMTKVCRCLRCGLVCKESEVAYEGLSPASGAIYADMTQVTEIMPCGHEDEIERIWPDEIPVVSIGQGDSRTDIGEGDLK